MNCSKLLGQAGRQRGLKAAAASAVTLIACAWPLISAAQGTARADTTALAGPAAAARGPVMQAGAVSPAANASERDISWADGLLVSGAVLALLALRRSQRR